MEAWRDIPGYEGIYEVSDCGRIRSKSGKTTRSARQNVRTWRQRILKQKVCRNNNGRSDARVDLWKDGRRKTHLVARLVAMTWVEGYSPELTVNHRDGDPMNNSAENLEWLTRADNIRQGFKDGLYHTRHAICLTADGAVYEYGSLAEASRSLGRRSTYVSNRLKKERPIIDIHGNVYEVKGRKI